MPRTRGEENKRLGNWFSGSITKTAIAESGGATASSLNSASQSTESTSNSAAFSRALKKLQEIDFSFNIAEQIENPLIDYIGRVEGYTNHRLRGAFDTCELNDDQWQQVDLAAKWAVRVHKINASSKDTVFKPGSLSGNTRTFCLHSAIIDECVTLVIAFRATRYPMYSPMEMAVNMNAAPTDCEELEFGAKYHRGFFRLAKNMEPLVAAELEKFLINGSSSKLYILFTGHSSGAAVAQLLFAFMHSDASLLALYKSDDRIVSIDCVTFGGPPVCTPPITVPSTKMALFLSFINEGDPIALAQENYMQSLIRAWTQPVVSTEWDTPEPFYIPSGGQIVLRCETDERGDFNAVVPLRVDLPALRTIIFGDLVMHSMSIYQDRIQKILEQLAIPRNPFQDP